MLTQEETKRLAAKCDASAILDTNLKSEVLKVHVESCIEKIQTKLKRTRPGGKVVVLWSEMR